MKLFVQAYDWVLKDKHEDDGHLAIHCWGLNQKSEINLLRIVNYPASCFVELPAISSGWNSTRAKSLVVTFKARLSKAYNGEKINIHHEYGMFKRLYYFQHNKRFPMIKLGFDNLEQRDLFIKWCSFSWYTAFGSLKFQVHEKDITSIRKLLTLMKLKYAGWLECHGVKPLPEDVISNCQHEYMVDYKTLKPVADDICRTWFTYPAILSIDAETYSNNHRAMPEELSAKHHMYMLSLVYQKYQKPETRHHYGIVIGCCGKIEMENQTIYVVANEDELFAKMAEIIQMTDPVIVTGYNTYGYDFPYMEARITRKINGKWPILGKLVDVHSTYHFDNWTSSAYKNQSINYPIMEGRIPMDMLPIIKRKYTKMYQYKLDYVAHYFLGKGKMDVTAKEMFETYELCQNALISGNKLQIETASKAMARIMHYCLIDSVRPLELMDFDNTWTELVQMANVAGVTILEIFTKGQQIRIVSNIYDLASSEGYVLSQEILPNLNFTGAVVFDPTPGLYDRVVFMDFASLYPSIIIAKNICHTTYIPDELGANIPDSDCHVIEFDQEEEVDVNGELLQEDIVDYNNVVRKTKKKNAPTITRHYKYRFYAKQEGLLPKMEKRLVAERKAVRALQATLRKTEPLWAQLEARQLAIKVLCNSVYGYLGTKTAKFKLMMGAMSITAVGRKSIIAVQDRILSQYGGVTVVGDTDSCGVVIPACSDRSMCAYWGEKLSKEISGVKAGTFLPGSVTEVYTEDQPAWIPGLSMEFEKALLLLTLKKKKYVGVYIDKKGNLKHVPIKDENGEIVGYKDIYDKLVRGIISARRDNCGLLRRLYDQVVEMIMQKQPYYVVLEVVTNVVMDLIAGKIAWEELTIVHELGSGYKQKSNKMKIFGDELVKNGIQVRPGDRLEYIMIKGDPSLKQGYKMRLAEQYTESLKNGEPMDIDYMFYLEKQLMKPLDQLLSVAYGETIAKLGEIWYLPPRKRKKIQLDNYLSILFFLAQNRIKIDFLPSLVKEYCLCL